MITTFICIVTCHIGSAEHFAHFTERLIQEKGMEVQVFASPSALKKFKDRQIPDSHLHEIQVDREEIGLAERIAKSCPTEAILLTEVGHPFAKTIQSVFRERKPEILRYAYYDNPESFVPGGYSEIASEVMEIANRVLFANANQEVLPYRVGIGYYPITQSEELAKKREFQRDETRNKMFTEHQVTDQGQKIFVYFGGNNEEYFSSAFPAFLHFLSESVKIVDLSSLLVVFQQHPSAKKVNRDGLLLEQWIEDHKSNYAPKILFSKWNSSEMTVLADRAIYFQTSMGPLLALAGIPVLQVGKETYEDVLIRNGICPSISEKNNVQEFIQILIHEKFEASIEKRKIFDSVGFKKNYYQRLKKTLEIP